MTTLPFKLAVDPAPTPFLLTIRGKLAAPNRDAGRQAHNMAAGSDEGVAMARSFGDLSHAVWVPADAPADGGGELLILDVWNSLDGFMTFFGHEQVQQGGKLVFQPDRDSVIWQSSPGLPRFNLPAPTGRNDRYLGIVRGPIQSREGAEKLLSEVMRQAANTNRAKGLMSREWYFRMPRQGEAPSLEAIGVDIWFDAEGMQAIYADPKEMEPFGKLFTGQPQSSVWKKPEGHWVEW